MIDKIITIGPSSELKEMMLSKIVGRSGRVIEDLTQIDRKSQGYLVYLKKPHLKEHVWYIPKESITYE